MSRETSVGSFIGSVVLHTTTASGCGLLAARPRLRSREENARDRVPPEWTPPSRTGDHSDRMHVHLRGDSNHLDLWVNDGDSLESEVERLVALGARRMASDLPKSSAMSSSRTRMEPVCVSPDDRTPSGA